MKNANLRLNQTFTFIRDTVVAGLSGAERTAIYDHLTAWRTGPGAGVANALSVLGSQENAGLGDTPLQRKYRRGIIFLKCICESPNDQTQWAAKVQLVRAIPSVGLIGFYQSAMEDARDTVYSTPARASVIFQSLVNDPLLFLSQHKVSVNGSPNRARVAYAVIMQRGVVKLDCIILPPGSHTIHAINIPAKPWLSVSNDIDNIQETNCNIDNACNQMFTTQFSGCTYCFQKNGGNLLAAHIDPGAPLAGAGRLRGLPNSPALGPMDVRPDINAQTGEYISDQLRRHGAFAHPNGGQFRAFGRVSDPVALYGYGEGHVIIMAFKRGGLWEIFAQIQNNNVLESRRLDL